MLRFFDYNKLMPHQNLLTKLDEGGDDKLSI